MEQKSIVLNRGIVRTPTAANVGELSECANLVCKNGEIVNAPQLNEIDAQIPEGSVLRYIHKVHNQEIYVVELDGKLAYCADGSASVTRPLTEAEKQAIYSEVVGDAWTVLRTAQDALAAAQQSLDRAEELTPQEISDFIAEMDVVMLHFEDFLSDYDERVYQVEGGIDYMSQWTAITGTTLADYFRRFEFLYTGYKFVDIMYGLAMTYVAEMGSPYNGYQTTYKGETEQEREASRQSYEYIMSVGDVESGSWYVANMETLYSLYEKGHIDIATIQQRIAELQSTVTERQSAYDAAIAEYNRRIAAEVPVETTLCASTDVTDIKAIGNILIINDSNKGIIYAIWKDGKYNVIDNIPEIDLRFCLDSVYVEQTSGAAFNVTKQSNVSEDEYTAVTSANAPASSGHYEKTDIFGINIYYYYVDIDLSTAIEKGRWIKIDATNAGGYYKWRIRFEFYDANGKRIDYKTLKRHNRDNGWTIEWYNNDTAISKIRILYCQSHKTFERYLIYATIYESRATDRLVIENTSDNVTALIGRAVKFIDRHSVDDEKFMFPFFVRYALKMADGSYINPSAPILMQPNVGRVPLAIARDFIRSSFDSKDTKAQDLTLCAFASSLLYRCVTSQSVLQGLQELSDMISGVVVAVSAPIYTFNQGEIYEEGKSKFSLSEMEYKDVQTESYGIGRLKSEVSRKVATIDEYLNSLQTSPDNFMLVNYPTYSAKEMNENVENSSNYYIVKEIKLSELSEMNDYEDIDLDKGTLRGLLGRTRITDNSLSLNKYAAKAILPHNNRLLIGNVAEYRYNGYSPNKECGAFRSDRLLFERTTTDETIKRNEDIVNNAHRTSYAAIVELTFNNETKKVYRPFTSAVDDPNTEAPQLNWFYYPSSIAKKVILYRRRQGEYEEFNGNSYSQVTYNDLYKTELPLKEHSFLDGSYWFDNFANIDFDTECDMNSLNDDEAILIGEQSASPTYFINANKILHSKVNNPFAFDVESAEYVGNGKILNFATNMEIANQGRTIIKVNGGGIYSDLLCFCSDGIYTLSLSNEGKIETIKALCDEIITEGTVPLQTGKSIVFVTNGGLLLLHGGSVENISAKVNGMIEDMASMLTPIADVLTNSDEWKALISEDDISFNALLQSCEMLYDSVNNLIHVYSTDIANVHYIFSLETGEWTHGIGGMPASIVPGYPYSTIQYNGHLYAFLQTNDIATQRKGILLTREISFDNPLCMKMLHWTKTIKKRASCNIRTAILVSNDREHWMRLTSVRKHSYKWYRFAIFSEMSDVDGICGIVCGVEYRRMDKPR